MPTPDLRPAIRPCPFCGQLARHVRSTKLPTKAHLRSWSCDAPREITLPTPAAAAALLDTMITRMEGGSRLDVEIARAEGEWIVRITAEGLEVFEGRATTPDRAYRRAVKAAQR